MGLLQNGFRDTIGVFRTYGATISNNAYPYIACGNYNLTGMKRNLTAGEGITDDKVGVPMGYTDKGWIMPQKSGQLSARAYDLAITATATGILGMPGEGSATFSITTNNPAGELIADFSQWKGDTYRLASLVAEMQKDIDREKLVAADSPEAAEVI